MMVRDVLGGFDRDIIKGKSLSSRTRMAYLSDLGMLLDIAEILYSHTAESLVGMGRADMRRYMMAGNSSPRTQRRRQSIASQFFEYCIACGIMEYNPADGIKSPTIVADPNFITDEEFDTLMESAPADPSDKYSVHSHTRDLSIMSLLFLDGLGIGEILEKTYKQITETKVKGFSLEKINDYKEAFSDTFGRNISDESNVKFYRNNLCGPITNRSVRRNFSSIGRRVLGRDDITPRTIHNGYLKIQIDGILAEDSEIFISNTAKRVGATISTVCGLIRH